MNSAVPDPGRILLIGTHQTARHNHSVSEELAFRLRAEGWCVITASTANARLQRLADMVWTAWQRRSAYDLAQIDVYSGNAFIWAEATTYLTRRLGKPVVLTLHGGNLPAFSRQWPGRVKRLLDSATVVTTPSGYLLDTMSQLRKDVHLVPNAIDTSAIRWRRRDTARPRIIWLRAFHEIYDPRLAPRIVALLRPDFPEICLTMVGPDKDGSLASTIALSRRLEVESAMRFPGGISYSEVPRWLNRADIFLNTSTVDNTPVSVLEAMAAGLPVVSTDVGGIPYLVRSGDNGLLVPPSDAAAAAAAIRRILLEPGLSAHLSDQGRSTAESRSWEHVLPQWERLLTGIIQTGAPPVPLEGEWSGDAAR